MSGPLRFTVAFDEADSEGIVFFGNYFRLAHRAFEAWLPARGITWHEWFAHADHGAPLKHAESEYLSSLRPGDQFEVSITVDHLGTSSVRFAYLFAALDGRPLARLKTTHVFVSRSLKGKMSIPEDLRARLRAE